MNEDQEVRARAFVGDMPGRQYVGVESATQFFRGEEYHQDFIAKQQSSTYI